MNAERRLFALAMMICFVSTCAAQTPPAPFTSPAAEYSGTSGPGAPIEDFTIGGFRSGPNGVTFQGPHPKAGWTHADICTGSAVTDGLFPSVHPIWDLHLRDTIIILGGDGHYYMTGSSGDNIWDRNDGVELWWSRDLRSWDYLGLVWSIDQNGTWEKQWRTLHNKPARSVWAPELHYINHQYYIALCMAPGGTTILKSTTGTPVGPYVSAVQPDQPLTGGIDATLFADDDGSVYFTSSGGGTIFRMKPDMSGFDGPGHKVEFTPPDDGSWNRLTVAQEGASIFKADGKYYLTGAAFYKGRYSSVAAIADNIYGPYTQWHEAVPCGGGGNYFRDRSGVWYCTVFGNDTQAPWREKPGIVKIGFAPDGRIIVAKDQPDFLSN
jgi:xylan 1,4-beta-xylosidase